MSLIGNCLGRLVTAGTITQKQADDALAIAEGMQGRLYPNMGPASADAASALEAARAMAAAAKERKLMAAKQAIRFAAMEERVAGHSKGKAAGLMGILTRDIWEEGQGLNIDSHAESVMGSLFREAAKFLEPYRSRAAGLVQDVAGVRNVIYENFGRGTGDAVAAEASRAWRAAVDLGVSRAKAAGKAFHVLDDWRQPQFWEQSRVKGREAEFVRDIMAEYEAGALRIMEADFGGNATRGRALVIATDAARKIVEGRHQMGAGRGFSGDMRVFRFDDPDAWLRMADKYGAGQGGLYTMMAGHLHGMAQEIALSEVLGPSHAANFGRLLEGVQKDEARLTDSQRIRGRRMFGIESAAAAQRTYDYLSGKLGVVESEMMAGIFGGLRSLRTASTLGSAIISAVPGDSVTAMWAANWNGIPASAVLGRAVRDILGDSADKRGLAAQLDIVAHSVMDAAIGAKRFEDEVVGRNLTGRLASFIIRAQGLQAWTEGLKRAFMMEFNGYVARQGDHEWTGLDKPFRNFLKRYGFTSAEWDSLRATPALEVEGARFFDVEGIADAKLRDRLMSAMIDERRFAVLEPDARVRQLTTAGQRRGTFMGELARSATLFKSFSMTVITTHLMRHALTGNPLTRPLRLAGFMATMAVGGAVSMQAKSILAGRDPRDMGDPQFWLAAMAQGGGGGIYGDLIYSGVSREGFGWAKTLSGPIIGEIVGLGESAISAPRKLAEGEDLNFGASLAKFLKRWTPGSSLWYARVAADRLIFDQVHALVDPRSARDSARRLEKFYRKEFGSEFWWAPGKARPARPPDLGAALP